MCGQSIPVRLWDRPCAFGPFPFTLGFLGFICVGTVHSRPPCVTSCSFGCVRSIPVRPEGRRVAMPSFGGVRSILLHRGGRRVRSCALAPFPCALRVDGFLRCVFSISVRPWGGRVTSGAFSQFLCALGVVLMRSVHSVTPLKSSWSFLSL